MPAAEARRAGAQDRGVFTELLLSSRRRQAESAGGKASPLDSQAEAAAEWGLRSHRFGTGRLERQLKLKIHHIQTESKAPACASLTQFRWHQALLFQKPLQCVRSFVPVPIKIAVFEHLPCYFD